MVVLGRTSAATPNSQQNSARLGANNSPLPNGLRGPTDLPWNYANHHLKQTKIRLNPFEKKKKTPLGKVLRNKKNITNANALKFWTIAMFAYNLKTMEVENTCSIVHMHMQPVWCKSVMSATEIIGNDIYEWAQNRGPYIHLGFTLHIHGCVSCDKKHFSS